MKIIKLSSMFFIFSLMLSCFNENTNSGDTIDPLFERIPEISNCYEGTLSEIEKQKALNYVNALRLTHGLLPVEYTARKDVMAQSAALICAANSGIKSVPTSENLCYKADGAQGYLDGIVSFQGSATANWQKSEVHINEWIIESGKDSIDERRWILDPFLKHISFGRVIGTPTIGQYKYVSAAVLIVKHNETADLSDFNKEFVAYPQGVYNASLFDPNTFLSFSVIVDKTAKQNNASINFANAVIKVLSGANELPVTDIRFDNRNCGLPNNLQWKVEGLSKNVSYTVNITNVETGNEVKNYEYTFSFK
ncbi:MAG: hypothetical protein LBR10_05280 [Prevotellaceae bacterium]|jgi:hypothetical protein|nr:hypothetical protein [Prevotellaceae bacterium]